VPVSDANIATIQPELGSSIHILSPWIYWSWTRGNDDQKNSRWTFPDLLQKNEPCSHVWYECRSLCLRKPTRASSFVVSYKCSCNRFKQANACMTGVEDFWMSTRSSKWRTSLLQEWTCCLVLVFGFKQVLVSTSTSLVCS
jgi:hypothetical protein